MRGLLCAFAVAIVISFVGPVAGPSAPALAKCNILGFEVNDYGKDGPKKDALRLLDGHIKTWASENNIKRYRTGKKKVSCRLFLDFGFFDEWTCTAKASVCY